MAQRTLKRLLLLSQLFIGGCLLFWLLSLLDLTQLRTLNSEHFRLFFLGGVLFLASSVPESGRMSILCRGNIPYREVVRLTFGSFFFANILPTNIGGDAYKILVARHYLSVKEAAIIVLCDRLLGLTVLVSFSFVALYFLSLDLPVFSKPSWYPLLLTEKYLPYVFAGLLVTLLLAAVSTRSRRLLANTLTAISDSRLKPDVKSLLGLLLAIVCFHGLRASALIVIAGAMGGALSFPAAWAVMAIAAVVSLVPISIAGLGVREAAFAATLPAFGMSLSEAVICALVLRLIVLCQGLLGGCALFFTSAKLPLTSKLR